MQRQDERGFTTIEIFLALCIAAVLLVLGFIVMNRSLTNSGNANAKSSSFMHPPGFKTCSVSDTSSVGQTQQQAAAFITAYKGGRTANLTEVVNCSNTGPNASFGFEFTVTTQGGSVWDYQDQYNGTPAKQDRQACKLSVKTSTSAVVMCGNVTFSI